MVPKNEFETDLKKVSRMLQPFSHLDTDNLRLLKLRYLQKETFWSAFLDGFRWVMLIAIPFATFFLGLLVMYGFNFITAGKVFVTNLVQYTQGNLDGITNVMGYGLAYIVFGVFIYVGLLIWSVRQRNKYSGKIAMLNHLLNEYQEISS